MKTGEHFDRCVRSFWCVASFHVARVNNHNHLTPDEFV